MAFKYDYSASEVQDLIDCDLVDLETRIEQPDIGNDFRFDLEYQMALLVRTFVDATCLAVYFDRCDELDKVVETFMQVLTHGLCGSPFAQRKMSSDVNNTVQTIEPQRTE